MKDAICYMYSCHYIKENITVFERDPSRKIYIEDPDECKFVMRQHKFRFCKGNQRANKNP